MNLEQLRKQAKELVRAARSGDEEAQTRIDAHAARRDWPLLADAQLALAREHGYPSWPALVAAAKAGSDAFVLAATSGRRARAEAMLAERPAIASDPWAALVLGRGWEGDPIAPGGPRGWSPILYVCHSCFASVGLARQLLKRGADPNASFRNEHGRMSALYGAAGVVHDPALTRLLLEAGADPDDGESLYHATEAESPECLQLLLEHGATTRGTNALAHALDFPHLEYVRLLLEAGADPNEGPYVAHAVRRGRDAECIRLLAQYGADLDRPGGEMWRRPARLRTPYQHAVIRGRAEVAAALAELGASSRLDADDEAIAAIARGETPSADLPDDLDYDAQEALIESALDGDLDLVVDSVGADFAGVVGGSPRGTLLQHAAWLGRANAVARLVARGADPDAGAGFSSALGWAAHGSRHALVAEADYVAVAERLVSAGAALGPDLLDDAEGPLRDWLAERLALLGLAPGKR